MRAVKSVLTMAGQLKRGSDEEENFVLYKAMRDSNMPKFLEMDVPLFKGIIRDLFPDLEVIEKPDTQFLQKIEEFMLKNDFQEQELL